MVTTNTPQAIDDAVLAFCATVAPGAPEYVDVVQGDGAQVAYCFDNAAAALERGEGVPVIDGDSGLGARG